MPRKYFFLIALLLASCKSGIQITHHSKTISQPVVNCIPTGGVAPRFIDTSCVSDRPCFKIRSLDGELRSDRDDYGLSIAVNVAAEQSELLCFTSRRQIPTQSTAADGNQNIWIAIQDKDGNLSHVHALTKNANLVHEGAASLSPDGQWIYFAAKNRPDTLGDCDIYFARLVKRGNTFSIDKPRLVPNINSKYFDSHPSLSADGTRLYFSSDRPSGYGNLDLWFATRVHDGWSVPVNAGAVINTTCNEMTPYICGDNQTLYFASDGFNSAGGFDLFYTVQSDDGVWQQPSNVGYPINTKADEIFPSTPPNVRAESVLYFASNHRGGARNFDLYATTPNPEPPHILTLRGKVRSMQTKEPIAHATLFWRDKTLDTLIATVESNENGDFFISLTKGHSYEVGAQAERYFFDTHNIEAPKGKTVWEFDHDFFLVETLSLRINFPFKDFENPTEFVLDDAGNHTNTTWRESIQYVALNLKNYLSNIDYVILAGHTDQIGTEEYNKSLSEKRAEFIKNVLVKDHGVDPALIRIEGKGKTELLPRRPDENDDLYNARCRRVELTKIHRRERGVK